MDILLGLVNKYSYRYYRYLIKPGQINYYYWFYIILYCKVLFFTILSHEYLLDFLMQVV